jgi:hypothetical protein
LTHRLYFIVAIREPHLVGPEKRLAP